MNRSSTRFVAATPFAYLLGMCRNIRVLHHFEPPTSAEEMEAAALQYVRKVSGLTKPPAGHEEAFAAAVAAVTEATRALLGALPARGKARTRAGEQERAKARWTKREEQLVKRLGR